jgi:cytochrome bd-type quinol oxidase subunit 1
VDTLKTIVVVGALIIMLVCAWRILQRAQGHGFGPNTTRALGIALFIPGVIVLAVTTEVDKASLMTLLGTVAGYALSNSTAGQAGE